MRESSEPSLEASPQPPNVGECLFCRIVDGRIPASVVAEHPLALAFRDINPTAPTHALVIPRRHIPHAASDVLRDTDVILLKHVASGLARVKSQRVWNRTGPGAWLTHQAPRGPKADLPAEVAEDMDAIEKALEEDS